MSREAYQIPTAQSANPGGASGSQAQHGQQRIASAFDTDPAGTIMHYICGDCGVKLPLKRGEAIRCMECGCRVLYKERTKRMVQFEAR
ncbi:hypothetical protein F4819DRAFT_458689 [Hypoxylon fuscum]|nr:hypothetical protein F4819DRAFT_458689 [Hypoxylon fuscum]